MASAGEAWSVQQALCRSLCIFVDVKENEVSSVLCSFFALFSILASYFLLLPLREDAGIALGTSNLPTLFACSLLVTLLFTPAASAFLTRHRPMCRDRALKQFYCFMASVLLVFYFLYSFASIDMVLEKAGLHHQQQHAKPGLEPGATHEHTRHVLSYQGASQSDPWSLGTAAAAAGQNSEVVNVLGSGQIPLAQSAGSISKTAGLVSQVYGATSSVAVAAGVYKVLGEMMPCSKSSRRHAVTPAAEITTVAFRRLQQLRQNHNSTGVSAPAPLPGGVSSSLLLNNSSIGAPETLAVGNSSGNGISGNSSSTRRRLSSRDGDLALSQAQRMLRGAFYVWVNVMNLVGISSLWARCADAFTPEAGARLFGFISAGATLGQLFGSVLAMVVAWTAEQLVATQAHSSGNSISANGGSSNKLHSENPSAPAAGLILGSAVLQLIAAQLIVRVRPMPGSAITPPGNAAGSENGSTCAAASTGGSMAGAAGEGGYVDKRAALQLKQRLSDAEKGISNTAPQVAIRVTASGSFSSSSHRNITYSSNGGSGTASVISNSNSSSSVSATHQQRPKRLRNVLAGFKLIMRSQYLLLLCGNLLLTYVVGSLMYFQRALVVSMSVKGPSYRTAFFATLNTWSAACILLMQLFATSSLLKHLGMQMALGLGPLICLVGLVCISGAPSPAMVAVFEVVRKVFAYAVYRPSREVLFTVVSRDEKYSAKLVIDTVVQRMGDAIAAAAFEVLDVWLGLGQAGVGAAGCMMCCLWLATGHKLGLHHKRLAFADAVQRQKAAVCD